MSKQGPRHLWFKLAVGAGSLLGALLLVQSIIAYYQVSGELVTAELETQARRRLTTIQREFRQLDGQNQNQKQTSDDDQVLLNRILKDTQEEEPHRFAWIRLLSGAGQTLINVGNSTPSPFTPDQVRLAYDRGAPVTAIVQTENGKAAVFLYAVRLGWRPVLGGELREPEPGPGPRPGARFIEMALYWDSASQAFNRLRTDLIISCLAALGLVASVVLLWSRFPHYIRGAQLEQQTEVARRVQADLLPPHDAAIRNLDFSAECIPAWQVGGDFYDVFSTEAGRIAFVVGDVSGKGLPASVLVGLLLGAVRASNWLDGKREHEASSKRLDGLLHTRTSEALFASMFWGYYDFETQLLRYINAGHLPPIVVRRAADGVLEIERLEEGGPVLGIVAGAEYRQGQTTICPGDLLVLFSDGVVEAGNAAEEQFGEERLLAAVRDRSASTAVEIRDEILKRVHEFLGKEQAQDDLTLVVARILAA